MVVICPKCRVKMTVPAEKIAPGGTRFRCPKCQAVLLVKKPQPKAPAAAPAGPKVAEAAALDPKKVMVAHAEPSVTGRIKGILEENGFSALTAADGVSAMVQTMKERPFLILVDVALPKIYGFEVVKRLKARPETGGIKAVLLSSIYDKRRYRREPASLYEADDYLDEHRIEELLIEKVRDLQAPPAEKQPSPAVPRPPEPEEKEAQEAKPQEAEVKRPEAAPSMQTAAPPPGQPAGDIAVAAPAPAVKPPAAPSGDAMADKAKRLARTIVADINLYSPEKVDRAIIEGNFHEVFSRELKEGKKLYEMRIPPEVRQRGDFFREAIDGFIENRKKSLGI